MTKKLNIFLAGPRGFCAGVDRAIEMVKGALKKYGAPVYVRHEIVHNKFVVENLKSQGAIFVEELNEIEDRSRPVIFSAHGVPKAVPEEALSLNLVYYDATCPLVSKIHKEVENFDKKNLPVILIGHRNHPEVIGTMGQTDKKIHLVEKVEDVKKLPLNQNDEIAYVTQTTLSVDDTKDIIKEIKLHFSNVIEPKKNDICYATTNRQEAVKKIANQCDYFLVIGASNSSNSLRLVEVAKNYGSKKAILVEDVDSLNLNIFQESENIGITASASSPEVLVKKLLDNLKRNFEIHINEGSYQKEDVFFKVPQKLNV
ncbi:4-hydroxy-3-methylbut-2-enyl diphosphate reductase [Pelagibacteraceae bacterium]|jgi:4-hydroxy-3-methylbut-2-enyl diphosphate reductase|nr:4-hydroxy-3-methylbut-2-enyl diphosphate reductase [Pelagibacteraceae bacterium]GIR47428.1 MAG: 4-hydroxy-3-methylbut-2-enyl diphosphate reductase [Alphaproteobacteria bacterium]|tara:strand:+ start:685 stop:1626 length:942 start_codon:yes stop_codon:yes gene_type:complete